ncbi:G5 domain-containing protein [Streptococcus sp. NLN76]|uniref:G5 domain-containing protein n=1 Tax=Streptococcus sp. NLN76 TaxID=2822800 RepID=UPI0018AAC5CA|nr:G5 domain-containing protein [Streptococcus sp. NLN76]MBF8970665.1 G5 domain-containing protein [Streptococcus sp. NLN76]
MDRREVKQRFSIRKYKLGVASVLLATVFAGGLSTASPVSADEVEGAGAESQEATGQDHGQESIAESSATYGGEAVIEAVEEEVAVLDAVPTEVSSGRSAESNTSDNVVATANTPFRSTSLRNNETKEVQIYSQSQSLQISTNDARDQGAQANNLKGYMLLDQHTNERETVRWELDYIPNRVNGRPTDVPVGVNFTSSGNIDIIPSSVKFNGQSLESIGNGSFFSSSVKAKIGQTNRLEFLTYVDRKDIDFSNATIRIATDVRPNAKVVVNARDTPLKAPNNRNIMWATPKFETARYHETVQEIEGPKDSTELVSIPFTTVYQADDQFEAKATEVIQDGKDGQKNVVTTYSKNEQGQFVPSRTETVIAEPVSKIVKVGTKSKVETLVLPFETVYQDDPDMKVTDPEVVLTEGRNGQKTVITTYTLDSTTGEVRENPPTETVEAAITRQIRRGTNREGTETPYATEYRANQDLVAGTQRVIQEGQNGEERIVLEPVTGSGQATLTSKSDISTEIQRIPQVIMVLVEDIEGLYLYNGVESLAPLWNNLQNGDKLLLIRAGRLPEIFETPLASFSVKGQDETIRPLESVGDITADQIPDRYGLTNEEIEGAELRFETDPFTLDDQVLNNNPSLKALMNRVGSRIISIRSLSRDVWTEKRYRQSEAAFENAGFPVTYDDEAGLLAVETKTKPITKVIYKPLDIQIGDDSGELRITDATLTVNGQSQKLPVQSGKVASRYQPESDSPIQITYTFEGTATRTRTITTIVTADNQLVDRKEQEVSAAVKTDIRPAVTKIVEVGTKAKIEVSPLAFETIYQEDPNMKADDPEVVVTEGQDGRKTVTTTYSLNPQTGEVTANEPTEELVAAVNRVIRRGVGQETKIPFDTVYVANEQLDAGRQVVEVEGVEGVRQPNGAISQEPVTQRIQVGTKPKVEERTLDYNVSYRASDERPLGWESVYNAGVKGLERTTTAYILDPSTGVVTAGEPTTELVRRVIDRVYTIGTMPKIEVLEMAFQTEYIDDSAMKADDPEVVVIEGQNGQKTITTTYTLNETTGEVTPNSPTEELIAAVNRVIRRGVGQNSKIPFETLYLASMELAAGEQQVLTPGVEGTRHPNGSVTQAAVNQVIQVGVKPLIEETVLIFETVYQDDATMKTSDPEVVVVEGQDGLKTMTTTYSLDSQTGQVTANAPTEVLVAPINRVIKRGVGQDTSLPFDTVYIATTALDAGVQQVLTPGVEGIRHPNGSIIKEAVAQIVQVGVKPVMVIESLAFQTVYQDDASMKATDPEVLVQAGQAGQRVTTTTYVMDEKTGLVSPQAPVVQETAAVDRIIKRGVGQETEIPFTTVYLATNTLEAGQKVVVIAGQNGLRHPNGSITKEAVAELVQVGVKPLVMMENLPFQTIYQDDTSMKASDPEVLVQAGQAGQRVTITHYVMDEKTGLVSPQAPVVQETAAVDRILKRGVGQETEIPFTTVYLATTELVAGQQQVLVAGQNGLRHPNGSVSREMVPAMTQVGIKPVVVTEELSYQTRYQEDSNMLVSDPEVVVQAGQTGQRIRTTNYSLDQATGQVTALTPILVETAAVDQIIKRGAGQNTELPFATHYVADATLAAGEKDVRIQGQTGIRHPNGSITKEVVAQVVAVGTRPSQRTETVAFATRYLEAKEMAANSRRTLVEGQTGQKTFTVTYVLNAANGQVTAQPETEALTTQPVTEVIEVGTNSTMRTVDLEFSTVYKEDKEMTAGQQVVDQEGQKGLDTYTTTYVLNVETGQVTAQPEVVERTSNPVARVVRVGVKPLVVETELGFATVYQDDPMMLPTDKEVVLVEGQIGKETRTTNYVLDIQTGQVTAQEPIVERQEAVNRLVKRGVGQTSPIAFKVIYKGDVTLTAGQRVVDQEGQEGLRHPNGSVLKEAFDQIIRVGLKPVERVEELPFEEEVIEDPNLPLGQICVEVEGQAGKRITRITYSLNPETGEVTAHESVETLAPVKRIVRKGTKVEEVCPPAEVEVSTPAPEAKVLPNTGTADSAALLVAGGLAGLAGLGLAAKKREED